MPLSLTESSTWGPGVTPACRWTYASSRSAFAVSMVSHAARQAADRLHLLRLAELPLQVTALGHVEHGADHPHGPARVVALDVRPLLDDALLAARPDDAVLDDVRHAVADGPADRLADARHVVGVDGPEEGFVRGGKRAGLVAEDAVHLVRPPQ